MKSEGLRKILSDNIKKYRCLKNYSRNELAEKTELSSQTIVKIEAGTLWPSDKTLCRIAEILNVEAYKFFIPEENLSFSSKDSGDIKTYLDKYIKEIIKDSYEEYLKERKDNKK